MGKPSKVKVKFLVGGPRQAVYDYLQARGFIMSNWSDKHWARADGLHVHVFGAGSQVRVTEDRELIAEGPLEETMITALANEARRKMDR